MIWLLVILMALPSYKLEAAFGIDPRVDPAPGDWVAIGTDATGKRLLKSADTKRGKNQELDAFEPGTMTLELDDPDRRFEPEYASSPYYPDVVPDTHIRLIATHASIDYPIWRGYVNSWVPRWELPGSARVSCTDAFKYFATRDLLNPYVEEVLADSPSGYWRLNESSGPYAVDATENRYDGHYVGEPTFSQDGPITDSGNGAILWPTDTDYAVVDNRAAVGVAGTAMSVEFWAKIPGVLAPTLFSQRNMAVATGGAHPGFILNVGTTGLIFFDLSTDAGGYVGRVATTSATNSNDGEFHHFVFTRTAGGTTKIYLDAVDLPVTVSGTSAGTFTAPTFIGIASSLWFGADAVTMDEVAVYPTVLSAARISAHYEARNSWESDLSGVRLGKVADQIEWPTALRDIDTGNSTLQAASTLGSETAMSHMRSVEASEFGALYVTADGELRFRERHAIYKAPYTTSQVTIGRGVGELPYVLIEPESDDNEIRNEVKLSRDGGGEVVARESNRYFYRTYSRSGLQNESDEELRGIAQMIVNEYKVPHLTAKVILNPRADDALWPQVLGRELEDRITLKRIAPDGSGTVTTEYHIQSISHTIKPGFGWQTTWGLRLADTQTYWLAGIVGRSEAGVSTYAGA